MRNNHFIIIGFLMMLILFMSGCGDTPEKELEESTSSKAPTFEFNGENPVVTMTMQNGGEVKMELYPDVAPNTVFNFISLIEQEFYNGVIFHRVIPEFMIQGGDPDGNGSGGPGYSIAGEFSANGFENELIHDRGVLSMARTNDPNSAGSQFFIMTEKSPHLDGEYAAFGKVIEGMDVVDDIVHAERDELDKPLEDQKIKKMTVDTKGNDFPEPTKQ